MPVALTEQQSAAVNDRGGNLLVSAAAGSGKTRVLVERLMGRVKAGEDVDRFLIITFTNAAAAELRDRISLAMSQAMAEDPGSRHLRRNATLVWRASICTIDAFCLAFLRECGAAAGLEPDFRLCDEAEGAALRAEAMEAVLERRYQNIENDPEFAALVDALAGDRDDRALEEAIYDIHGRIQAHPDPMRWLAERKADFDLPVRARPEDTAWGRALLEDGAELCRYWAGELNALRDEISADRVLEVNFGGSLEATAEQLGALTHAMDTGWEQAASMLPVRFPRLGSRRGADPALKERAAALRELCKKQMGRLAERFVLTADEAMEDLRAVAPAMTALLDVTAEYDREFTRLKRRRHLIDFADGEHLTAKLLVRENGQPSQFAADWSRRYAEIMVDEYQDTNAVQNVIFNALSTGDNLFLVGDVKQSIYRFRLADPTIFLEKYGRYADYRVAEEGEGRTILLSRNFRSRPEVLEAVNFLFRNVMTKQSGEMDYTGDEALLPGREDLGWDSRFCTELDCVDVSDAAEGPDGVKPDRELVEARAVAGRISGLLEEGLPIGGRPVTPEDIVILLRSPGPVLRYYSQALDEAGIPWRSEGGGNFFSSTEVSVALSLLRVIDNPRQDVPLLSVLRSPLYGFDPDRLAELRAGCGGSVYDCLSAGRDRGEEDCRRFMSELAGLRALAAEESAHRLIWYVYEHTGLLAVFSALPEGERRRANLLALHEAARQLESTGHKGLSAFLTHIGRMAENGIPVPVPAAGGGGVRILSIHKSKGLEFPVVFVCALERQFNEADSKAAVLFDEKLGLGPGRTDRERMLRYPTIARDAVALRLRSQLRAEEMRLLYVAMTRAEHKLFLFTAVNGRGERLSDMTLQARCPPPPQLMAQARSMTPWVLIPALCRAESTALWEGQSRRRPALPEAPGPDWEIRLLSGRECAPPVKRRLSAAPAQGRTAGTTLSSGELAARFRWRYPYAACTDMPSKLTATQLKGREKDSEAAEDGVELHAQRTRRVLRRPIFEEERPLSAAEKGTALHMAMQYLDYAKAATEAGVREEVARLVTGRYITPAQGRAVDVKAICAFFASGLGKRLLGSDRVEREFKFSMLVPAAGYRPECGQDEEVLLQGVVDCWFCEADGTVTVVDFKTDAVTEKTVYARAESYRPQLEAYARALEEIAGAPVGRRSLWFFALGREVAF